MKRLFIFFVVGLWIVLPAFSQSNDYYLKQAESYQREAKYYFNQAEGYEREAKYYNNQAQKYLKDAEYYADRNNLDKVATLKDGRKMQWIKPKHVKDGQKTPKIKLKLDWSGLEML